MRDEETGHRNEVIGLTNDLANHKSKNEVLIEASTKLEIRLKEVTQNNETRCRASIPKFMEQARLINMDKRHRDSIDKRLAIVEKELSPKQIENVDNFMLQGHPADEYRPLAPELIITPNS